MMKCVIAVMPYYTGWYIKHLEEKLILHFKVEFWQFLLLTNIYLKSLHSCNCKINSEPTAFFRKHAFDLFKMRLNFIQFRVAKDI